MEIWLDDEALAEHFTNAKNKMRGGGDDDWEPVGDGPAEQNELTRGLKGRR